MFSTFLPRYSSGGTEFGGLDLLNSASRYDIRGKKILESNEKVYWVF